MSQDFGACREGSEVLRHRVQECFTALPFGVHEFSFTDHFTPKGWTGPGTLTSPLAGMPTPTNDGDRWQNRHARPPARSRTTQSCRSPQPHRTSPVATWYSGRFVRTPHACRNV